MMSAVLFTAAFAQTTDTVYCGAGFINRVFYNMNSGTQTPMLNATWHLAFTVRPSAFPGNPMSGTVVRYNGGTGIKVYRVPGKTAADFNTAIDTTGMSTTWNNLIDPDTSWGVGAFNANKSTTNIFNFGWGTYNQNSKDVVGDSIYVLRLQVNGLSKKFTIEKLVFDSLWMIRWADLDGSNPDSLTINKKQYTGKNFVYVNLLTKTLTDPEPLSANWDLLFNRYASSVTLFNTTINDYPLVGVLSNIGVQVAEARGVNKDSVSNFPYNNSYTTNISEIGWDWKSTLSQAIIDSLVYFVKAKDGNIYKTVFTYYGGNANGKVAFTKSNMGTTSVKNINAAAESFSVYPNPTSGVINLVFNNTLEAREQNIQVTDVAGKTMFTQTIGTGSGLNNHMVNLSNLPKGLYFVTITAEGASAHQRVLVK